jgi:ribosome biogenesis GTPase / thiamine phosphate phosphatase
VTRRHHLLDEDDIRVRPGRGKSRPRSKERPEHAEAQPGTVTAVDRGRFTVEMDDGVDMYAIKARELGRKGIVVGDRVEIVGDLSGDTDTQGRIVRRTERSSTLRRTADDTDPVERVVVANATQLAIVTSTIDPEPRTGLIDRALVAALDAGIEPLLILTKTDLKPPDELLALYGPLDVPLFTITGKRVPDELRQALADEATVLVGHSGVGKSTLVNNLVPSADRSTGIVNAVTGRGRHTSTSVVALHLPTGGMIIDTPGIRSFGLAHVDVTRVINAFPDLASLTSSCPRACSHDEPDCALNDPDVVGGTVDPLVTARIDSLRRLIRSRSIGPDDDAADDG